LTSYFYLFTNVEQANAQRAEQGLAEDGYGPVSFLLFFFFSCGSQVTLPQARHKYDEPLETLPNAFCDLI
jgi:hypothetical protein